MARRKSRSVNGLVAWLALIVALMALGVALSGHPAVRPHLERWEESWGQMREELHSRRGGEESATTQTDAAGALREASAASEQGEGREARRQLREAITRLREQATALRGAARERCETLTEELRDLANSLETGAESARALTDLAERAETLTTGEKDSESD